MNDIALNFIDSPPPLAYDQTDLMKSHMRRPATKPCIAKYIP